jgi:hypothetical protein
MKAKTLSRDEFFRWDMKKVRALIAEAKSCDGDVLRPLWWKGFGYGGSVTKVASYKNGKRVDNANQRKIWERNEDLG